MLIKHKEIISTNNNGNSNITLHISTYTVFHPHSLLFALSFRIKDSYSINTFLLDFSLVRTISGTSYK